LVDQAKEVFRANKADPMYRKLLRQAANLNSQTAIAMLGTAYVEGHGGEARPDKALECFMQLNAVKATN
jgi:TPR repeat protein